MVLQDHSLHGETLLLTSSNVLVRAPTVSFPKATAATKCIKALKVGMLRKEWSKGLGVIWYKQEKTILSQNPCYQCIAKKVITRAVRGHLEYSMPYWWDIKLFHRCFIPYNIYSQYCADKCLPTDPLREKKKLCVLMANFYGVNSPTMADFKLSMGLHQIRRWEEVCTPLYNIPTTQGRC